MLSGSFPDDFLWGVATSAFQLEGSPYADWTSWDAILSEKPEVTSHYALYKEDLALLKELGVNAYRFSLEWSRIQPKENAWDQTALSHYQEIIDILGSNNIEPMVTLHHFTHPLWFIKKYPWHEDASAGHFMRYIEKVLTELRGVRYWITFNEPYVLLLGGYLEGCMPPGIRDAQMAIRALRNILTCHAMAYEKIHETCPDAMVSVAHNMAALAPWRKWNPMDRLLSGVAKYQHILISDSNVMVDRNYLREIAARRDGQLPSLTRLSICFFHLQERHFRKTRLFFRMLDRHAYKIALFIQVDIKVFRYFLCLSDRDICKLDQRRIRIREIPDFHFPSSLKFLSKKAL